MAYLVTPLGGLTGVVGGVVKLTGGLGLFAQVVVVVSPRVVDMVVLNDRMVGGVVPRWFLGGVEMGVGAALS
ncbi:elongation factor G, partial [Stenotrophomonas maltophilia]